MTTSCLVSSSIWNMLLSFHEIFLGLRNSNTWWYWTGMIGFESWKLIRSMHFRGNWVTKLCCMNVDRCTVHPDPWLGIWDENLFFVQKLGSYVGTNHWKYFQSETNTFGETTVFISQAGRVESEDLLLFSTKTAIFFEISRQKSTFQLLGRPGMHISDNYGLWVRAW